MATILGTFKFKFEGDNKDLNNAIDDSEKKGSSLGKTLGSIGKIAGGVALGAGITAAPGYLMNAAKAAADDEAATLRLNQTLSNLADVSGSGNEGLAQMQEGMEGLIKSGQDLAFSDDEVRDGMQFLIGATGDFEESSKRLAAAQDLARGANIPLSQATKMLGKLNGENVEVFKKLGITLGENATEADALAAVQQRFGNQADAYAQSTAGQFAQAQLRMGELQETIGMAILPIMTALGEILVTVVIPAFEGLTPVFMAVGEGVAFLAEHIKIVIPALAAGLIPIIIAVIPLLYAKAAAWWAIASAVIVANAPLILIIAAFIAVGLAIGLLITYWDDLVERWPVLGEMVDALKEKWNEFVAWIKDPLIPAIIEISKTVAKVAQDVYDVIKEVWDKIEPLVMLYLKSWLLIIETGWDAIKIYIEMVLGVIRGIIDVFMGLITGDWDRAWSGVKQIFNSVMQGIKDGLNLLVSFVWSLASLLLPAAKNLGTVLKDGFIAGVKGALGLVANIGNAVIDMLENAINQVVTMINNAIPNSIHLKYLPDIDLPDNPIGYVNIPHLASGGIVTRPTLALIGEAGDEAVVPLRQGWQRDGLGRGLGHSARAFKQPDGEVTVNIDTVIATTPEEARLSANRLAYGIKSKLRRAGAA